MNKIIIGSIASLGLASFAMAAGSGDILLGFKSTNAADASSVTFNLASITTFKAVAPGGTLALGNVDSALDSAFNANGDWAARTNIQWGVLGYVNPADNAYDPVLGYMNTTFVGSNTVAYANSSSSGFGTPNSKWTTVAGGVGAVGTSSTLLNSDARSWKGNYGTSSLAFGKFQKTSATLGAFDNSTNFTSVSSYTTKLFELVPTDAADINGTAAPTAGQVTYLGLITLASNGDVSFTAAGAVIPEPSTYAALLGGAALGFAALRRRRAAVLA
ncbi:PEP-CTERM sorting domain-containing protein [Nibricoccus sp. IMCC34717]|uniref:PEP-CTERM sorting domain-containing protein n=1 Tax=Nibricoccus sp. IMCC34717 TaxID=3034021 RepID=UPI00384F19B9